MSEEPSKLERLITRYLDEECSARERRELEQRLDDDPSAAELFDDYAAIDREVGSALQSLLKDPVRTVRPKPLAERYSHLAMLAAAACLAALLWFAPQRDQNNAETASVAPTPSNSWFAPPGFSGDALVERPASFDEGVHWVGKPQTEWIVIPTERSGEYMVIEVDKVVTQTRRERRDY